NVGIGRINPTAQLHINGNLKVDSGLYVGGGNYEDADLHLKHSLPFSAADYNGMYLSNSQSNAGLGNYGAGLIFSSANGTNTVNDGSAISSIQLSADEDNAGLAFWARRNSNSDNRMRISTWGYDANNQLKFGFASDIDTTYTFRFDGTSRLTGLVRPEMGIENDYLSYRRVNGISAAIPEDTIIVLLHGISEGNFCQGTYYGRRSTALEDAVAIDIMTNTDDFNNADGWLKYTTLDSDLKIELIQTDHNGETYVALMMYGDNKVRDGSYFQGFISSNATSAPFTVLAGSLGSNISIMNSKTIDQVSKYEILSDSLYFKSGIGRDLTLTQLSNNTSLDTVVSIDPNGVLYKTAVSDLDGDWTLDGDTLYSAPDSTVVIKDGNVGIGTSNPTTLLNLRTANSLNEDAFTITEHQNGNTVINAGLNAYSGVIDVSYRDGTIENRINGDGHSFINLNQRGNFGIGTSSPTGDLHVNQSNTGNGEDEILRLDRSNGSYGLYRFITSYSAPTPDSIYLTLETGSGDHAITVHNQTGNVGIGTTSHDNQLHVVSSSDPVKLEGLQNDASLDTVITIDNTGVLHKTSVNDLNDGDWTIDGNDLYSTADSTIVLVSGNVGIGTSSPAEMFEVDADDTDNVLIRHSNGGSVEQRFNIENGAIKQYRNGSTSFRIGSNDAFNPSIQFVGGTPLTAPTTKWTIERENSTTPYLRFNSATNNNVLVLGYGGNVGIGTTIPGNKLHISATSDPVKLEGLQNDASLDTVITVDKSGVLHKTAVNDLSDGDWTIDGDTLYSAPDSAMVIKDGNVGIGSLNPANELEVVGRGYFSQNLGVQIAPSTAGNVPFRIGVGPLSNGFSMINTSNGNASQAAISVDASNHAYMYLYDNANNVPVNINTNGVSWLNGGNIGIGTTSPSNKFHISAASDPVKLEGLQNDASLDTVITVDNAGVLHKTAVGDLSDGDWTVDGDTLYSAPDSAVVIKNGNMGINEVNPTAKLEVHGDSINSSAYSLAIHDSTGSNNALLVRDDGRVGVGTNLLNRGQMVVMGPYRDLPSGSGQIAVLSSDSWAKDKGGQIVLGGAISAGDLTRTFASVSGLKENSTDGNRAGYLQFAVRRGTGSPTDLFERMRINSLGNVGIAHTDPQARFQINMDSVGTDSAFVVTASGNVGVGTTSPSRQMEVIGSGANDGVYISNNIAAATSAYTPLTVANSANGSSYIDITSPGSTSNQRESSIRYASGRADFAQHFSLKERTTSDYETRFFVESGGNVGIGPFAHSDGPQALLQVNKEVIGTDSTFVVTDAGNTGIGITSPSNKLHISATSDPVKLEGLQNDASLDTVITVDSDGVLHKTAVNSLSDGDWTVDGDTLYSAPDSAVVIKNGNVGIGTTSPNYKLELHGETSHSYLSFVNSNTGSNLLDGLKLGIETNGEAYLIQRENADLTFRTNNADRFIIKNTGNIGIGTNA
ncbi:MAG: hypothetical protein MRY83_15935, partial [Flavobacteriales bacterium]|nr:hypothetical protein [Flavobacteriales bacterium]